jgi:predicted amidohydrolase
MNGAAYFAVALALITQTAPAPGAEAQARPDRHNLIAADGSCWKRFAPRPVNSPSGELTKQPSGYTLTSRSGDKAYVYGGWSCRVEGVDPERHYRVRAQFTATGLGDRAARRESVGIQIRWRGDFGEAVAPTYVWDARPIGGGDTFEFDRTVRPPAKTHAADIELVLQWAAKATVAWRSISVEPVDPPAARRLRLAAVWLRPQRSRDGADSVRKFAEFIDGFAERRQPDLILLGEMINRVGAPGEPDDQAEPVPGPTTALLAERARRYRSWIAFSMVERDGTDLFNTAILLDRTGRIAGKYRKVQLPFEEVSRGIAPGDAFPVFDTEFGRLGMLICHDASFPEASRELALQGAELILMPIWGGRQTLVRARAIENGIYLATAGYNYPSEIISPTGEVLAQATPEQGPAVAIADLELDQRPRQDWIGDWNDSYMRQQRPAPYGRARPRR